MVRVHVLAFAAVLLAAAAGYAETPAERGAYLVNTIGACGNCHTPKGPNGPVAGMELAGGFVIDERPFRAVGSNITPDRETGIGGWTDAQIVDAIRNGRRPDGSIIGPPMPIGLYRQISDSDVNAIVAYLRTVKPVRNKVEKSVYRIPLQAPPAVSHVSEPNRGSKLAYGAYLAGPVGHCIECHTPMTPRGPDFANRLGAGGFTINTPGGAVTTTNITPDPEDGIGRWSNAQIARAITEGVRPDGSRLVPIMPVGWYRGMKPEDVDAIVTYLRALKPLKGN